MTFRNLRIGTRAAIGFALITGISLLIGGIGLWQMERMNRASDSIHQKWMPSVKAANEMGEALTTARAMVLRMSATDDAQLIERSMQVYRRSLETMTAREQDYVALLNSDEERQQYVEFRAARDTYLEQVRGLFDLLKSGQHARVVDLINGDVSVAAERMNHEMKDLSAFNETGAQGAADESDQVFAEAVWTLAILLGAGALLSVLIALGMTRSIVAPLIESVSVARRIAGGDLTEKVRVIGRDEPAQLLAALREMQDALRGTLQHIIDSSSQLASAAEEMSAVTEDATRGLHRQTGELEQVATAVNEMTSAVEEVAGNAVNTSEATQRTNESTQEGDARIGEAMTSIDALVGDMRSTSADVEHLAEGVNDISKVLDVIRGVAEQTNLLALNAAIEAARAGEQGRGFAVVADEVRALAHRTQQSTEEIEQMIRGIQDGAERAVAAIQKSSLLSEKTGEQTRAAGEALREIGVAVAEINDRNLVIASASEQQAQVARSVDEGLVNIRDLALQTAAGADQTNAASQDLSRLAVDLNQLVTRFRL